MTLKDLLKKKEKARDDGSGGGAMLSPDVPEFTFMRTTTTTQDIIQPPTHPDDPLRQSPYLTPEPQGKLGRFRRHSHASEHAPKLEDGPARGEHRRTGIFGRSRSSSSANVPQNLPDMGGDGVARTEDDEAQWEKRATLLAKGNALSRSGSTTPNIEIRDPILGTGPRSRSVSVGKVDDEVGLHVRGERVGG